MIFYFSESSQNCVIMPLTLVLKCECNPSPAFVITHTLLHRERWLSNSFVFHVTQSDNTLTLKKAALTP